MHSTKVIGIPTAISIKEIGIPIQNGRLSDISKFFTEPWLPLPFRCRNCLNVVARNNGNWEFLESQSVEDTCFSDNI